MRMIREQQNSLRAIEDRVVDMDYDHTHRLVTIGDGVIRANSQLALRRVPKAAPVPKARPPASEGDSA